ncbi:MAG: hypothetical protein GY851_33995 [bacterium]|nr:hypothetical protein [bacterium]
MARSRSVACGATIAALLVCCGAWSAGPYGPGSFEARLADALRERPDADKGDLARGIAHDHAGDQAGADAVEFLGTAAPWSTKMSEWMRAFAWDHADTVAGDRALDLVLTHLPPEDAVQMAGRWEAEHPRTRSGLRAAHHLIRYWTDEGNRQELEGALSSALKWYDTSRLWQGQYRATLVNALDSLGEPCWADRLSRDSEDSGEWSRHVALCRRRIEAYRRPATALTPIASAARGMFAADYASDETAMSQHYRALVKGASSFALSDGADAVSAGDILETVTGIVEGVGLRSKDARSLLGQDSEKGDACASGTLAACLDLLTQSVSLRPDASGSHAVCAKKCGDSLAGIERYTDAERYYDFAMIYGEGDDVAHEAAMALARVYSDAWKAYGSAETLLRETIDKGAPPRALMLLARLLYLQEDYDGVLDALNVYVAQEDDPAQVDRGLFIMGQALGKLGNVEEQWAIWEDVRARTKDPTLLRALDAAFRERESAP